MRNKGGHGSVAMICKDCKVRFTVYARLDRTHCPKCADHVNVRLYKFPIKQDPDTIGTGAPLWDELQDAKLVSLYNGTGMSQREIGERLEPPRSKKGVAHRINILRDKGVIT